jgi:hypothetical protein
VPHQLSVRRGQPRLLDERRPEGVTGTRQEVITLTTQEPGRYRLPPWSLDWWNTATGRWETAMLPARDLVVSAGPAAEPRISTDAEAPRHQGMQPDRRAAFGDYVASRPAAPPQDTAASTGIWIWIAGGLGLAWIVTMAAWWRSRRGGRGAMASAPPTPEPAEAVAEEQDPLQNEIDRVRAAYLSGDAGAAREALLAWAKQALPGQTPSNLARLAERCHEPLRGQILLLEEAFFSPTSVPWDKQAVWEELRGFVPAPPAEPASFRRGKPIRRRAPNPDAE